MSSEASPTTDEEFDPVYFSRLAAASDHWWVQGMHEVGRAMLDRRTGDADVLLVADQMVRVVDVER